MKKSIFIVILIWVLLISASFFWNYLKAKNAQKDLAFQNARSFFNQIVFTRDWNAEHGGVYVPITENTLPNPYLDDPLKNLEVKDHDFKLTLINPAFMTRQISEIAATREGIQFHITSLLPIRPGSGSILQSWPAPAWQCTTACTAATSSAWGGDRRRTRLRCKVVSP